MLFVFVSWQQPMSRDYFISLPVIHNTDKIPEK